MPRQEVLRLDIPTWDWKGLERRIFEFFMILYIMYLLKVHVSDTLTDWLSDVYCFREANASEY